MGAALGGLFGGSKAPDIAMPPPPPPLPPAANPPIKANAQSAQAGAKQRAAAGGVASTVTNEGGNKGLANTATTAPRALLG